LTSGSVSQMGSIVTWTCVIMSPLRTKYSVSVV
jgi:hypothetical protein